MSTRPRAPLASRRLRGPVASWLVAALTGIAAPATAMFLLTAVVPASPAASLMRATIIAIGLMGSGMMAAAISGRLRIGLGGALLAGAGLLALGQALATDGPGHLLPAGLALSIAAASFAARGALFARSAGARGWWIALAVVAGEAAMVASATARPDAVPEWLLALLPAQWASTAIGHALAGSGTLAAAPALVALAVTAASTRLVAALWPRRWPYLVMFSAWLACSALVLHHQTAPLPVPATERAAG